MGYEQQRLNGELLRRSYVRDGTVHQDSGAPRLFESADLRKLPPTERDFFLLRSDDMERTIMSGQALFDAMFPHPKYYIWGATAGMLVNLAELILAAGETSRNG